MTPPGHAVRQGRPGRQESEQVAGRRLAIVVAVLVVVVGAALIDQAVGPPPSPAAPSTLSASTIPSTAAAASSWYCAGGTTGFGAQANTTIYVTNTGTGTVPGAVSTTVNTGKASVSTGQTISVPALSTIAVNPGILAPVGYGASTLTFAGGGIGVSQVAAGPDGWTTAPCASATSANWYFASGATTPGSQLVLTLYNPTSTEAVANVSFDTDAGVLTPQLYQGLVVPAGQSVVENVGDYVQSRPTIATVVSAQSGQIVADQLQLVSTTGKTGLALALGAPRLAPHWYFSQTTNPTATGSGVSFMLSNPGPTAEKAVVAVGLIQGGVAPVTVAIPAKSVVPFTATTASRIPRQVPYSVAISSTGGSGLVVAREVVAPDGASQPGFGTMLGTAELTQHWLVPAPGAGSAPGAPVASVGSLAVSNPGTVAARVTVAPLGGTAAQSKVLLVKPHSLLVLAQAPVGGLVTLDVRSSVPVAVEEDNVPSGATGVVSSTGLPFG
ncbi:MAG TPA: hypothetical protein VHU17_21215 [Acidimicrobiales bacterium]|nr:hypothetical protein [Acidimicrobiales bacterium]